MRLRNVSMTRLVREVSNDRKALSEYERQSYTSILGAVKVQELEEFVDCLNGREYAKESLGRQTCRYGAHCRNGDGKACRFLHPERKAMFRQVLIKELDRYAESKGYRKTRRGSVEERASRASVDHEDSGSSWTSRSKTKEEEARREKSSDGGGRAERSSSDRRESRSPGRRVADRYGSSSDSGSSRKGASFKSAVPIPRPR